MNRAGCFVLALMVSLAACQAAPEASRTAGGSRSDASASQLALPSADVATPPPPNGCVETPLADADGLISGSFADVVTTDLVTRTAPRVAKDSAITGELNRPARVYVVEGPVPANGYEWWSVIPEGGNRDAAVWVAAQGKDGEVWMRRSPDAEGRWAEVSRRDVIDGWPTAARAATAGGRIYFFGGQIGMLEPDWLRQNLSLDLDGCTWDLLADMPIPASAPITVAADGRLFVLGEDKGSAMQVYDPEANAWTQASGPPRLLAYESAVTSLDGGNLVAFDGEGILAYDAAADAWNEVQTPERMANRSDAAVRQDKGGVAVLATGAAGIWRFDLDERAWSQLGAPRVAHYNADMVALPDGRLVVTGGSLAGGCYIPEPPEHAPGPSYDLVDVLDPDSGTWEALPPLPLDLVSTAPIIVDNQLYVVGLDQTVDFSGSDPVMSHVDVVVVRYVPPATTVEEPAAVDPGAGGCGG